MNLFSPHHWPPQELLKAQLFLSRNPSPIKNECVMYQPYIYTHGLLLLATLAGCDLPRQGLSLNLYLNPRRAAPILSRPPLGHCSIQPC